MHGRLVLALALACMAFPGPARAASLPAVVTLLEGEASLVRGTARYALAEGVRIQPGDIVELPAKALVEIEFADGVQLGLGPEVRVLFQASPAQGGKTPLVDLYFLRGWMKVTGAKGAAPARLGSPLASLTVSDATAVARFDAGELAVFAESGEVAVSEWAGKGPAPAQRLKAGEFYARKGEQKGTVAPRVAPAFVSAMPVSFRDNLPSRAEKFRARDVAPKRLGEVSYAEVEPWLKAPLDVRRPLVRQLTPRIADAEFRGALVANLRAHPEWDPILFPEKYKPKVDEKAQADAEAKAEEKAPGGSGAPAR